MKSLLTNTFATFTAVAAVAFIFAWAVALVPAVEATQGGEKNVTENVDIENTNENNNNGQNNINNNVNNTVVGNGNTVTNNTDLENTINNFAGSTNASSTSDFNCTITVAPSTIANNQSATLSWSSTGATSATLSDGIGSVSTTGTLTVRPEGSRSYVLTIRNSHGASTVCTTALSVTSASDGQFISLTQVPYTGVTDSFMSMAYWLGLIGWAGAAGFIGFAYRYEATGLAYAAFRKRQGLMSSSRS